MNTEEIDKIKNDLKESNPELYKVAFEHGTEKPFSGSLLHEKKDGVFKCGVCGQALFKSDAKFDSGTGWPSFDQTIEGSVTSTDDGTLGMKRTEINCSRCSAHLGHVFNDGPTDTGMRYCMNSVSLDFNSEEAK